MFPAVGWTDRQFRTFRGPILIRWESEDQHHYHTCDTISTHSRWTRWRESDWPLTYYEAALFDQSWRGDHVRDSPFPYFPPFDLILYPKPRLEEMKSKTQPPHPSLSKLKFKRTLPPPSLRNSVFKNRIGSVGPIFD